MNPRVVLHIETVISMLLSDRTEDGIYVMFGSKCQSVLERFGASANITHEKLLNVKCNGREKLVVTTTA